MGLLDNLAGGVAGGVSPITGQPDDGAHKFKRTLKVSHFWGGNVALTPGEFKKLGDGFIVPAQERYRWGVGSAEHDSNQGYLYILVKDDATTPAEITGSIRIQQRNAQERNIVTVYQEEGEVLHGSKSNREQQQAFPEQVGFPKVGRDSILNLAMSPDTAATAVPGNSSVLTPVTVYPQ